MSTKSSATLTGPLGSSYMLVMEDLVFVSTSLLCLGSSTTAGCGNIESTSFRVCRHQSDKIPLVVL